MGNGWKLYSVVDTFFDTGAVCHAQLDSQGVCGGRTWEYEGFDGCFVFEE